MWPFGPLFTFFGKAEEAYELTSEGKREHQPSLSKRPVKIPVVECRPVRRSTPESPGLLSRVLASPKPEVHTSVPIHKVSSPSKHGANHRKTLSGPTIKVKKVSSQKTTGPVKKTPITKRTLKSGPKIKKVSPRETPATTSPTPITVKPTPTSPRPRWRPPLVKTTPPDPAALSKKTSPISPSKGARRSTRKRVAKQPYHGIVLEPWTRSTANLVNRGDKTYVDRLSPVESPAPSPHLPKPRGPIVDPTYRYRSRADSPTPSPECPKSKKRAAVEGVGATDPSDATDEAIVATDLHRPRKRRQTKPNKQVIVVVEEKT